MLPIVPGPRHIAAAAIVLGLTATLFAEFPGPPVRSTTSTRCWTTRRSAPWRRWSAMSKPRRQPEIAVVTVASLDGMSVEEYANKLFKDWGVGQKDLDNGVLILVAPGERKMRIEVGYGLEPIPPGRPGRADHPRAVHTGLQGWPLLRGHSERRRQGRRRSSAASTSSRRRSASGWTRRTRTSRRSGSRSRSSARSSASAWPPSALASGRRKGFFLIFGTGFTVHPAADVAGLQPDDVLRPAAAGPGGVRAGRAWQDVERATAVAAQQAVGVGRNELQLLVLV